MDIKDLKLTSLIGYKDLEIVLDRFSSTLVGKDNTNISPFQFVDECKYGLWTSERG